MHIKMAVSIFLCASVILWAANDQTAHAQMGPSQQGETQQQRVCYFPLIEGPGKIQIVNGGGNAAQCTVQFFNPDGTVKRGEAIEKDGQPMRTNRNGAITITLRPNATCDITIPGDEDNPVRCWVCLTCDQPNVNAFAKVTRRTEAGLVPLIYQCSHTGNFFAVQFGGLCPVRDQVICVANTGRAASRFILVLINKDGTTKAVKEVSLGGRNCRCLSLLELFPEYSSAFDGWLFAQFEFDAAVNSYAMGPEGNVFVVPVVEN